MSIQIKIKHSDCYYGDDILAKLQRSFSDQSSLVELCKSNFGYVKDVAFTEKYGCRTIVDVVLDLEKNGQIELSDSVYWTLIGMAPYIVFPSCEKYYLYKKRYEPKLDCYFGCLRYGDAYLGHLINNDFCCPKLIRELVEKGYRIGECAVMNSNYRFYVSILELTTSYLKNT